MLWQTGDRNESQEEREKGCQAGLASPSDYAFQAVGALIPHLREHDACIYPTLTLQARDWDSRHRRRRRIVRSSEQFMPCFMCEREEGMREIMLQETQLPVSSDDFLPEDEACRDLEDW